MSAIEQRHRKEIEKTDRNREHRRQTEQRWQPFGRHLTRDLSYSNRPAKLVSCFPTRKHASKVGNGALSYEPSSLNAELKRFESSDRLKVGIVWGWRPRDAENPLAMHVAEPVLDFLKGGSGLEINPHSPPFNLEQEGLAGAGADDLLHI